MVSRSSDDAARRRSHSPSDGRGSPPVIFPRRKAGQNKRPATHHPVVVTYDILSQQFDVPLWKACRALGICATAMKKVCRKLGVMKWPYKENHMPGKKCSPSSQKAASPTASVASADLTTEDSDMPPSPQTPPVPMASSRRAPAAARPVATRPASVRGSTRAASAAAAARVAALCAREREPIDSGSEVSTPNSAVISPEEEGAGLEEEEYENDAAARADYALEGRAGYEGPEEEDEVAAQQSRGQMETQAPSSGGDVAMGGDVQQPQPSYYATGGYFAPAPQVDDVSCNNMEAKLGGACCGDFEPTEVRIAGGVESEDYYSSDGWLDEPDLMVGECCDDFSYQSEEVVGSGASAFNNYLMCF
mmetsp:Transcript_34694/g.68032  ORF Transcript_34694/g.68032 Transcript_34694/m.68032 type:complete len:362 (+) Transcript_34694:268-1353(+)|eukprot:CAMPEP_0173384816 /NCGR_PEP_ID=MMETSP1356-20130122/7412_1 /TAXON_ID=77927 ORGANISM="Hemiselmis virescens, Strain PCC157" /NCGR_SAMPLE_ID=MMETSP1356 /ASSEMBLY_ACC=CAM_ASM_000847 /LENGTH=361 /DNA_ID=CAMNT_0014340369 /DNA_START=258 /DNA_END=1343 /DNA_ORIENTATION=+